MPEITIETAERIAEIADAWKALDAEALRRIGEGAMLPIHYTFYQTLPWNAFVEEYYASHTRLFSRLEYIVARREGRVVAILPLRISGLAGKKVEMTAWRTAGVNNVSSPYAASDDEADAAIFTAIAGFMAERYKGHRLRLFDMPEQTHFTRALESLPGVKLTTRPSFHIPLSEWDDFDAYYASPSKKLRHNIQTRSNHFTHGDLSWELKEYDRIGAPSRDEWLKVWRIFYYRKLQWNSRTATLLRRIGCEWEARREVDSGMRVDGFTRLDEARLCVFEINGEPAAFAFYYVGPGGHIVVPKLAIDTRFRTHAPGILMLKELLRRCYDRGIRDFDLCRGEEPYKQQMGAVCQTIVRATGRL